MPLTIPVIDDRKYQDLRDEGLGRIRVHNPEWTNFHKSDPGVTLVEVFAFLTESLLYRANQIPERNRRKFLKLLGIPLASASAARGLVAVSNDRGPLETATLPTGLEVTAGPLTFRLDQGLDVLPVEGRIFYKHEVASESPEIRKHYNQLYASFLGGTLPSTARMYESVPLTGTDGIDLGADTIDGSIWVALAARKTDVAGLAGDELAEALDDVRRKIGAKTLTLGVVPWLTDVTRQLTPGGVANPERTVQLTCHIPHMVNGTELPADASQRVPTYRQLPVVDSGNVLIRPGTVQITLPPKEGLALWTNLLPLEAGVGDFPPAILDSNLESRVVTWLRLSTPLRATAKIRWAGINAAMVSQRARVIAERLPEGSGVPDQVGRLARRPVLRPSVRVFITRAEGGATDEWTQIDDLGNADPEVPVPDPRLPPHVPARPGNPKVFACDAEAGEIRFGDGARGARPPLSASIVVDYEYSEGREGNVNEGTINASPALPPGFSITNPVQTWGGADAETVEEGEKQVQRWLQHRERLVSAEDFSAITWRTPGVDIGRVEVIPAASPEFDQNEPGDAPGAVTLMLIPRYDAQQPDAPRPDRLFLDAVCAWLDPRRLVTTEVFLRGPIYKNVWISVAIDVATEQGIAEVREAVERALRENLAPLPPGPERGVSPLMPVFTAPRTAVNRGWPLRKEVVALELAAVTARVTGVTAVRDLLLAGDTDTVSRAAIPMRGLELPRVAGIMVSLGTAVPIDDLRGKAGAGGPSTGPVRFVPVPVVPEDC